MAEEASSGNCRALVVDDNVDAATTLKALIETFGCPAQAITDPRDAEAAALKMRPRVAFLDLGMPHINGWQLAELLRRHFDHTALKLVAVTGYASFDDQQRSQQAGFDLHLRKPMEFDKLEKILSAYL